MALNLSISSSPLDYVDNPVFRKFKRAVVDGNVYDTGDDTYPITTSGITMQVSGASPSILTTIYVNDAQVFSFNGATAYTFQITPASGRNSIQARQGSARSNLIEFTGDLLYTLVYALVKVLRDREDEVRQAWANGYLSNSVVQDTYSNSLQPTGRFMAANWAEWLGAKRISGHTESQFLTMLQTVLRVRQQGPVVRSLEEVAVAAGGVTGTAISRQFWWKSFISNAGRVKRSEIDKLTLMHFPAKLFIGNRFYNLGYGNHVVTSDEYHWIYVDKSEIAGRLGIKDALSEPQASTEAVMEVITTGSVQTDTTGEITGFVDGKYVILERAPRRLLSVVQSGPIAVSGSSRIVLDDRLNNTAVIDLGTRLSVDNFGTLTIQYEIPYNEIQVLAKLTVGKDGETATAILNIESPQRLGNGARLSSLINAFTTYDLFMDNNGVEFTTDQINWMLAFLRELNHPAALGFLLTDKPGDVFMPYMYHCDGYEYQGAV